MTMDPARPSYEELCCYTLTHGDPAFIHQHVVDAFAAQAADEQTKPVTLTFALVGLYLHLEKQFTGRRVQLAHMKLARRSRVWPKFPLPADRGTMTAADVMTRPEGPERDHAIDLWCRSVWDAYRGTREAIADLLRTHEVV
jgi:Family of unknown function (DUF5946)